jgi:ferredoxin-NADP reductase
MNIFDTFLNKITMYKLVLYGLCLLALVALVAGFAGGLIFTGVEMIVSLAVIFSASYVANIFFAYIYKAPTNVESVYITALILFFILEPSVTLSGILILIATSVIAMLSKFTFAIGKKHIFNPVAISTFIVSLLGGGAVIWWVATPALSIATIVIGLLIVRKIRRFSMVFAFILTAIVTLCFTYVLPSGIALTSFIREIFMSWPLVFFATIMLTEPLTTPPTKSTRIVYGIVVGLFFASGLHVGSLYATPEFALVLGNIYAFAVSSKQKLFLKFKSKQQLSATIYDFVFEPSQQLRFTPGQYLEWTLPHLPSDSRGNRRYFTVASSPTEKEIHLGVRIAPHSSSSFKKSLIEMSGTHAMVASHLSGDFTMPKDRNVKLAFVAGGIGITPFRSMIKYLIDTNERRDIVLYYLANSANDFAYHELFSEAQEKLGIETIYIASVGDEAWQGRVGRLTPEVVYETLPDFTERHFYLSGPNGMVESYKKMLNDMNVPRKQITTDYFPGF